MNQLKNVMRKMIGVLILTLLLTGCKTNQMKKASVNVDLSNVEYTMKGGIGASWHAISKEIALHNEKYSIKAREKNPRGSGYGGNPPLSYTTAWDQLKNDARWLGLNFIRVEISQRMYEPERHTLTGTMRK